MTTSPQGSQSARNAFYSNNALKIGFFGPNCSSGIAATKVPERWSGSWEDNVRLATMLDAAGIEFLLPVARWKGWGGETSFEQHTFETITWSCGLLAVTKNITVFGTVHAPFVHPVFAAKQFVTADHIGRGRFGLNLVCGWNHDEFGMFGLNRHAQSQRYRRGGEWLDVIEKLWSEHEPFEFRGRHFDLHALQADPKPFGGSRPVIMNAGASEEGKAFALARADCLFTPLRTLELGAQSVRALTSEGREMQRAFDVYTNVHIICRPTDAEANDYYAWFADENADWEAVDNMHSLSKRSDTNSERVALFQRMKMRFVAGYGGYPLVGSPDTVAAEIARISEAGFAGIAAGLVNYVDEFPYLQAELLPRLERLGLRTVRAKDH